MTRRSIAPIALVLVAACGDAGPAGGAKAPPAPATEARADPVSEAATSYAVSVALKPGEVAVGGRSVLALEITPTRPDVYVQKEFPLRVTLAAGGGAEPAKAALGHADAVDPAARSRRWEVPILARAAGEGRVEASLRFALCKESEPSWCVTRNETVAATLKIR